MLTKPWDKRCLGKGGGRESLVSRAGIMLWEEEDPVGWGACFSEEVGMDRGL